MDTYDVSPRDCLVETKWQEEKEEPIGRDKRLNLDE
jgi:hypothetical protein